MANFNQMRIMNEEKPNQEHWEKSKIEQELNKEQGAKKEKLEYLEHELIANSEHVQRLENRITEIIYKKDKTADDQKTLDYFQGLKEKEKTLLEEIDNLKKQIF